MKVGIFDSGLGGLTVLKEIIKKYPDNEYCYFGDNINVPYGNKSKEELKLLVDKIIRFLISQNVDIIIIACGTVSSTLYEELKYNIPIYDIITPTIEYINESHYKRVGVIATPKTIESKIFNKGIEKEVLSSSCPLLASYIENDLNVNGILNEYLKPIKKVDALILGCTHYPLIRREIEKNISCDIIDMGKVLSDKIILDKCNQFKLTMYFTKVTPLLKNKISNIILEEYEIYEVK